MGVVEAVYDTALRRVVARKTLQRSDHTGSFQREAQVAAGLEHPGIVPIYDASIGGGEAWYTMRRIEGRPLSEAIAQAGTVEARLALLPAFLRLCEAMAYAHTQGVVHRDLKPANVMLGSYGEVVVVDFGLAVQGGEADGRIVGTPAYMSPEAANGERPTPGMDVWSLGLVLHELLTGQRAWEGPALELIERVRREDPPPPPEDLPGELRASVAKATRRDPVQRYEDAEALRKDVEAFTTGRLVAAHEYSARELVRRFLQRYRTPLLVGVAVLLVVLGTLSGAWWRTSIERDRALRAEAERTEELARSLEARARALQGDPEALDLARQALALSPALPFARGILAELSGRTRAARGPVLADLRDCSFARRWGRRPSCSATRSCS